jgi:hypothetical protein
MAVLWSDPAGLRSAEIGRCPGYTGRDGCLFAEQPLTVADISPQIDRTFTAAVTAT